LTPLTTDESATISFSSQVLLPLLLIVTPTLIPGHPTCAVKIEAKESAESGEPAPASQRSHNIASASAASGMEALSAARGLFPFCNLALPDSFEFPTTFRACRNLSATASSPWTCAMRLCKSLLLASLVGLALEREKIDWNILAATLKVGLVKAKHVTKWFHVLFLCFSVCLSMFLISVFIPFFLSLFLFLSLSLSLSHSMHTFCLSLYEYSLPR
jgi:hypothetical protein